MVKRLLIATGILEMLMGLLHFILPHFIYQSPTYSHLGTNDLSITALLIYVIGISLLAFGILSLYFSRRVDDIPNVIYFSLIVKSVLCFVRLIMEILNPVRLKLFGLDPFIYLVIPGLMIGLLIFVTQAFLMKRELS